MTLFNYLFQAVYNGGGLKNNRAGISLSAQDPIRLPVLSTKEFSASKGFVNSMYNPPSTQISAKEF